ncbi:unannotated protein [freshwater metagenome]|uniref:Unannotated protein n=1 Tax=freshwater metagenome TaxID=449393 RepID=A0A6J7E9W4_9ZZZZ|nr:hypothetical protein [Actinomycetota bacterium]
MAAVRSALTLPRGRSLASLLVALALTCAAAPAAEAKPILGIAEQQAGAYGTALFQDLGVRHARLNLAWDVFEYDWQVAQLDAWMAATQAAGVKPLVIFSQSRVKERTRRIPTPAQFGAVVDRLRERYPWLNEFATWNEANYEGQPTARNPQKVAALYRTLRRHCTGCTIAAAALLDNAQLIPYATGLRRAIRRLGLPDPKLWALHNYIDVNNLRDRSTQALLKSVQGRVWITETGGVVRATSRNAKKFKQGPARAAKVLKYILGPLVKRNPRITRIYVYCFNGEAPPASWDSGLIAPDGSPRPAYTVLKKALASG